jgi:heptosyltransferase III
MRILVLRGGALGDFLVTLPALGMLRSRWPEAQIELVGNARAGPLGQLGGYLDAVHDQHDARWSALYADAPLPAGIRDALTAYDLVVSYWPDPDHSLRGRFPVRPGQTAVFAGALPGSAPAARHFCDGLAPLGLATDSFRSRLPHENARVNGFRPAVRSNATVIHPGSGSPSKNWPRQRWIELIRRTPGPVILVLGEVELLEWTASVRGILAAEIGPRISFAIERPLVELAALLSGSRRFGGHDSGVSHLAAAVGTPSVVLFGPTEPRIWAPPGEHVQVIRRGPSLDSIPVETVLAALDSARAPASGSALTSAAG